VVDDGRTGLLVPPADPLSLAAAVKRLLSEPGLGRRLARAAGEKVASQFTVEGMVEKTVGVYNSFLGRR
jgi:glycosyltransferase involved in cell wall biosynthesis